MSETEWAIFLSNQRAAGRDHITRLMFEWRLELWPRLYDDPIHWEDVAHERRWRDRLRSWIVTTPVINPAHAVVITGIA